MAVVTTFLESGTDATQDFSFFLSTTLGGTGAIASDTSRSNTGPRAIKSSQGAGGGSAIAATPDGVLTDTGAQISFWINFDTAPGAISQLAVARTSANANVFDVRININGTGRVAPTGGTAVDGTVAMTTNTWYWIVVSYYITNTTTYQIKMYIHSAAGVLLDTITANAGTLTRTGTSRAGFGNITGNWANNSNLWHDDIYIATGGASSGSQPDLTGPIKVTAKRPNANGTTNGFTTQIGAGGSGYGTGHSPQVNEQPLSTTNGWSVVAVGSAVTEEYNVENASTGDVDLTGLPVVDYIGWVYTKALNAETGSIVVNGASSNISITTSNAMFTKAAASTTYPAGSGTDIGEVTDTTVTTVSLFECGIVLAFRPSTDSQDWFGSQPPVLHRQQHVAY